MKPPELKSWSKNNLIREIERLRAIVYEHAESRGEDPVSGGGLVDVAGDPHARGGVLVDVRKSVLLDTIDVSLVDTRRDEQPAMALLLAGRVNFADHRVQQLYMFGADGAAGLASELIALAARAGGAFGDEFQAALKQRMDEMP